MLADQARYDDDEGTSGGTGFEDADEVELTEENTDEVINYINSF